jgi:hypothetical protein
MIPQPTKEQARAHLLHNALMFAMHEQLVKSDPGMIPPDETWLDQELTRAVLAYLPHVSILAAPDKRA